MLKKTEKDSINNNLNLCACGCGQSCKKRFVNGHNKGRFKTGKRKNGFYVEILIDNRTYQLRHRKVFEEFHKCCLLKWGIVHHIIPVKKGGNDNIENLQGMTDSQHKKLHNKKNMSNRICFICESNKTYTRNNGYQQWNVYKNKIVCNKCYEQTPERKRHKRMLLIRRNVTF